MSQVELTGVEDTRLQAKAKNTKKIRGQGQEQPYRGQTLSRPRTGMLEAKAKDTSASAHKKRSSEKIFRRFPEKNRFPNNFLGAPQTFNNSKKSAVLEPRRGQFSKT